MKTEHCPNCGHVLAPDDNYCGHCGQANHDLKIPFRHLVLEAMEGVFHFDNKSFRTLKSLLLRPGFLTGEFARGRRAGYVPPVRLYIFLSFIFFLLLSFNPGKHQANDLKKPANSVEADSTKSDVGLSFYSVSSDVLKGLNDAQIDSVMNQKAGERSAFSKYVTRQIAKISSAERGAFIHSIVKGVSYMMFVLMPIFALFLYIFYRQKAGYYLNCLVFSVHFHSFIFLLFTIYVVLSWLVSSTLLFLAALVIIGIYLFMALRRVFGQSRSRTMVKLLVLGSLHLAALLFCFVMMVFANILLF